MHNCVECNHALSDSAQVCTGCGSVEPFGNPEIIIGLLDNLLSAIEREFSYKVNEAEFHCSILFSILSGLLPFGHFQLFLRNTDYMQTDSDVIIFGCVYCCLCILFSIKILYMWPSINKVSLCKNINLYSEGSYFALFHNNILAEKYKNKLIDNTGDDLLTAKIIALVEKIVYIDEIYKNRSLNNSYKDGRNFAIAAFNEIGVRVKIYTFIHTVPFFIYFSLVKFILYNISIKWMFFGFLILSIQCFYEYYLIINEHNFYYRNIGRWLGILKNYLSEVIQQRNAASNNIN